MYALKGILANCIDEGARKPYSACIMLSEDELRQFDLFVSALDKTVHSFPRQLQHCSLEALTRGSEPLFCIIRAGIETQTKNELWDYGKFQLRREGFFGNELRQRLETVNATGKLPTRYGDLSFDMRNSSPRQLFYPHDSSYHNWPGTLYEMSSINQQGSFIPVEPLVGRNLLPFFGSKDAIRHWIGVPVNDSDSRYGHLLVFIPDFTARLGQMSFKDGIFRVQSKFSPVTKLAISVLATDGRDTYRKTKPLRGSQTFKFMANPISVRVFITSENGNILDQFAEDQVGATGKRVIFAGARYSEPSMNAIRHGESDTTEFKEFIRLDDKKKAAELVKAVISFANTTGGTIFIGVTDDAEIEGIEAHIPHDNRKAETFQSDYFSNIRALLQQKMNRIPVIEIRHERVGDKTVFIVQVAEGGAKPYFNVQTNEIFVRRGASDVRPNPDADIRQMMNSENLLGFDQFD